MLQFKKYKVQYFLRVFWRGIGIINWLSINQTKNNQQLLNGVTTKIYNFKKPLKINSFYQSEADFRIFCIPNYHVSAQIVWKVKRRPLLDGM